MSLQNYTLAGTERKGLVAHYPGLNYRGPAITYPSAVDLALLTFIFSWTPCISGIKFLEWGLRISNQVATCMPTTI